MPKIPVDTLLELMGQGGQKAMDNAALQAWPRQRSGGFSVQTFRQLLQEAASNPEQINNMSDQELTSLFDEVIGNASMRNPGQ